MSPDNDPSWDVFLSYARKDDEKFVKKLRDDLVSEGKSVWWDREAMESRGRGFPLEIRDAIWHSNRVVAVLGPVALQSDYVRFEWSHAHLYAKAVVPILRKGAYDGLGQDTATLLFRDEMEGLTEELRPAELAERHCIDFTDDEKYPDALEELLDKLEGEILPLADLHAAPRFPPPNFVPLPKIVGMLSDLLIYDVDDPRSLRTDIRTTVLRGRGGMGKSVMANAFANAVKTRWAFLDGIFWVPIGRSPNDERLLEALRHIALHVDRNQLPTYTDRRIARTLLTEALSETRCLLILDDVWEAGDVRDFTDVLGPACSLLITTRNDDVAAGLGASRVDLETLPLKKSVALQLLGDWAKQSPETLPPEAEVVVKFCDHVPLALALCGALIQKGETSWPRLPTVLAEARERVLDSSLPAYDPKEINVFTPIAASLQYLKELDQEDEKVGKEPLHRYDSYVDLAVLPNDALTPEAVVCALWIANQALDQDLSVKLLSQLDSRALLRFLGDPPLGEILLHNLQHFFLASRIDAEETTVLHGVLGRALMQLWSTDRSRGGGGGGPEPERALELEEDDTVTSYCVRFLCRHLREGCCWEELGRLLADVRFLRRKQEPAAQLGLEEEILDLLADEEAPMERVLEGIASAIMDGMELSREKADWLDTLAYWMGSAKPAGDERRREGLKRVAIELDEACGEVSRDLAEKYLNEGELDSAMRFAELRTWVCQRRGDYRALVDACDAGEAMCRTEQVAAGYRTLGLSEFIRMRAYALTHLAGTAGGDGKDVRARVAPEFDELSRVFAEIGTEGWRLSREEWLALQERGAGGFALSHRRSRDDSMTFKANVVSNEHDAIGAMYLIQVLESRGGFVNWIHHKDFEPGQLDQEGARLTVLLGGPKTPDFSDVAHRFYESDRDAYLRMYSGLHFGPIALKLVDEETRSVAFMLGGASKLHTLQAVHDFANSDEVTHIIG